MALSGLKVLRASHEVEMQEKGMAGELRGRWTRVDGMEDRENEMKEAIKGRDGWNEIYEGVREGTFGGIRCSCP